MPDASLTKADIEEIVDTIVNKRESALLKWTIEVQLKFLAVQAALLTAFAALILGGVYFIVAHVKPV